MGSKYTSCCEICGEELDSRYFPKTFDEILVCYDCSGFGDV